jgi:hypothetical protein
MPLSPSLRRRRLLPLVLGCALGSAAVATAALASKPVVSATDHFAPCPSPFETQADASDDSFHIQLRSVDLVHQQSLSAQTSEPAASGRATIPDLVDVPLPPRDVGTATVNLAGNEAVVPLPPRGDEMPIVVPRAPATTDVVVAPHVTATIDVLVCAPESAGELFPAAADGWRPRTPSQELGITIAEQLPAGRARVDALNSDTTMTEFGEWTIAILADESHLQSTTLRAGFETIVAAQIAAGEPLLAPALTDAPAAPELPATDAESPVAAPVAVVVPDAIDSPFRSLGDFLAPVVTITELEQMADASNVLAPVVLANPLAAGAFDEVIEPLPPEEQSQLDAATADLFKPVTSIGIKPEAEAVQPPNLALHVMGTLTPEAIWSTGWASPKLSRYPEPFYHRPLRFEQANLERCGISHGCATTITSAACFFGSCVALPASLIVQPPCKPVETLGDCRTCQEFGKCQSWFR